MPQVESREVGSREGEAEEEEWGHANGSDVEMADIGGDRDAVERHCCVREGETQSMFPGDGKGRAPGLNSDYDAYCSPISLTEPSPRKITGYFKLCSILVTWRNVAIVGDISTNRDGLSKAEVFGQGDHAKLCAAQRQDLSSVSIN